MGSGRGKRDKALVSCCCGWCSGKQGHTHVSSFLKQGLVTQLPPQSQRTVGKCNDTVSSGTQPDGWSLDLSRAPGSFAHSPASFLFRQSRGPSGAQPCLCLQPHPYLKPLSVQNSCSDCSALNPADSCK